MTADILADLREAQAALARVRALADEEDARRLAMCRTCRDPEFGRIHSHDCGQTRKWFVDTLRAALDGPK